MNTNWRKNDEKRLTTILATVISLTMLSACSSTSSGTSTQEEIPKPENSVASAQNEFRNRWEVIRSGVHRWTSSTQHQTIQKEN